MTDRASVQVLNGICKVQKRPDKSERTVARLIEMKELAFEHDMKYSFHHKLRRVLTPAPPEYKAIADSNFATAAEAIRHNIDVEIKKLEQSATLKDRYNLDNGNDIVDVASLRWPMVFGEASVSIPEGRSSLGTVIADTYCEILWIHKSHIQTFRLGEKFHERLRLRSVRYPPDDSLVNKLHGDRAWSVYKGEVMGGIEKQKWPGFMKPHSDGMKF